VQSDVVMVVGVLQSHCSVLRWREELRNPTQKNTQLSQQHHPFIIFLNENSHYTCVIPSSTLIILQTIETLYHKFCERVLFQKRYASLESVEEEKEEKKIRKSIDSY
jgi:hypothetical protein